MSDSGTSGRPTSGGAARYQRSPGGMVAAMVILVAVVLAFVGFRALFRENPATPVTSVDYLTTAHDLDARPGQDSFDVVYPERLPAGWRATSVQYRPGPSPSWHLGMLTDSGDYVGLEQTGGTLPELVREAVDPAARSQGSRPLPGPGGRAVWRIFSDDGGDLALGRDLGASSVVVVGTAEQTDLEELLASLR